MTSLADIVPPGVVTGDNLMKLLEHARANSYAIPAVNCTSSSTANAILEAARKARSPVMVQIGHGEGKFFLGEGAAVPSGQAATAGSVALAMHVRAVAQLYGIPVVLHSDHCARDRLEWLDGMLQADQAYFAQHGEPLFSSHMLDLSAEPLEENLRVSSRYFRRMAAMNLWLETEIGITGGEEDGVNNEDCDPDLLYTNSQEVWAMHEALSEIGPMFSIAVAFGNVHGVYQPGAVQLAPEKLGEHQAYAHARLSGKHPSENDNKPTTDNKPLFLVMHGGSGSTNDEIHQAVSHGVVKMNVNTDTQWAYWDGLRAYEADKRAYLQGQMGNPLGDHKPNKKFYDPRVWLRKAEESMVQRVMVSMDQLHSTGRYEVLSTPTMDDEGDPAPLDLGSIGLGASSSSNGPAPITLMALGAVLGCAATLLLSGRSSPKNTIQ